MKVDHIVSQKTKGYMITSVCALQTSSEYHFKKSVLNNFFQL